MEYIFKKPIAAQHVAAGDLAKAPRANVGMRFYIIPAKIAATRRKWPSA